MSHSAVGTSTPSDPEVEEKEMVHCSPAWLGKVGRWRRDSVWVQEYDPNDPSRTNKVESLVGRLPGTLQIVIAVIDEVTEV